MRQVPGQPLRSKRSHGLSRILLWKPITAAENSVNLLYTRLYHPIVTVPSDCCWNMCSTPASDSPLRPSRAVAGRSVAKGSAAWAGALSSSVSEAPGWGGGASVLVGGWQGCVDPRGSAVGGCWHRRSNAPAHGALTRGAAAAASLWEVCSANAKFSTRFHQREVRSANAKFSTRLHQWATRTQPAPAAAPA